MDANIKEKDGEKIAAETKSSTNSNVENSESAKDSVSSECVDSSSIIKQSSENECNNLKPVLSENEVMEVDLIKDTVQSETIADEENTQIIDNVCGETNNSVTAKECEHNPQTISNMVSPAEKASSAKENNSEGSPTVNEVVCIEENESSTNLEESLIIESDDDVKKEEKSFGSVSQATTVDVRDMDMKILDTSQDLFASQTDIPKHSEESGVMDYEDYIPPSQSDTKNEDEKSECSQSMLASVSRKRKLEDDSQVLKDSKIMRTQIPNCELPSLSNHNGISEQSEMQPNAKKLHSEESTKETEKNESLEVVVETEEAGRKEKEDGSQERRESIAKESDSRMSVQIVYSTMSETIDKDRSECGQELLDSFPEENGDTSQDFVLRLSVSPSQVQVIEDEEEEEEKEKEKEKEKKEEQPYQNSEEGTLVSDSNGLSKKNCDEKSSTSISNSCSTPIDTKTSSTWNCHSSDISSEKSSVVVNLEEEEDDLQILSENDKFPLQSKATSAKSQEKVSSKLDSSNGSDVIVLEEKGMSSSSTVSHKDMNGTVLKRKKLHQEVIANGSSDSTVELEAEPECDSLKHTRHINLEDRNTPDILPLPNKSVSAVPLANVERYFFLKCLVRMQANEQTKHVHSFEMLEFQDLEDAATSGKNAANLDVSPGMLADVSEQSKNSSPSSVTSLGPFQLKTQSWRLSTSSSSTTSSGHSIGGLKSKSLIDWPFPAPSRPAPSSRSFREKQKNAQMSQDFVREMFELAEKKLLSDEERSKAQRLSPKATAPACMPVPNGSPIPMSVEEEDEENATGDVRVRRDDVKQEDDTGPETPKSTKKSVRISRPVRNVSRGTTVKPIKEMKEEEEAATTKDPQHTEKTPDDRNDDGTTGPQRKSRKTPLRSTHRKTPSNSTTEERKNNTTPSNRSRRHRNDKSEKSEKSEKSDLNSMDVSQHVYEWDSEGNFCKLVPDAPVFARWTDKTYYSGRIKEKAKDGRWIVQFDDNNVKPLKDEFIIPVNTLAKGQIVFVDDEDEYEQGIIVEYKVKNNEVQYGVELDSGRKLFIPRSKVSMSEDQARLLQENLDIKSPTTSSPALTTVTCDNIVQHKRPRSNRVLFGSAESPSVSGVTKTAKRSGKYDPTHDNSCSSLALPVGSSSSVSDSNDKGSTLALEEVGGVDPEVPSYFPELLPTPSGRGKGPGRIKSKTRTPRRNTAPNHSMSDTEEHRKMVEMLGPIPEKGSQIFSEYCFLLTHAGVKPIGSANVVESPLGPSAKKPGHTSSSEYEEPSTDEGKFISKFPFVKEHLKKQIEAGGGTVYENCEDVPKDQYANCFLLADRPCLTAKYIFCLANSIRIISHDWVIQIARDSDYTWASCRLDAGWDLEDQCYVSADSTMRTRKHKPLNRKEVGLVNDSQTFIKFWQRVLELMGATVRHISPEQDQAYSGVHVIVTDSSCPPEVQDRAREWSIPLVSPIWVTQSLIHWKARRYDGHPRYRYDNCSSE